MIHTIFTKPSTVYWGYFRYVWFHIIQLVLFNDPQKNRFKWEKIHVCTVHLYMWYKESRILYFSRKLFYLIRVKKRHQKYQWHSTRMLYTCHVCTYCLTDHFLLQVWWSTTDDVGLQSFWLHHLWCYCKSELSILLHVYWCATSCYPSDIAEGFHYWSWNSNLS